jgi:hypothetical protein
MDKLTRHQILLYRGDFERLKNIYANHSPTSIVRELVRAHLHRVEAKFGRRRKMSDSKPDTIAELFARDPSITARATLTLSSRRSGRPAGYTNKAGSHNRQ